MLEKRERIDPDAWDAHLEVEVRSGAVAGRSHEGDRLSRGNDVARLHERPVEMAVQRAQLRIASEKNVEAVAPAFTAHDDGATRRGIDRCAERSRQVDTTMEVVTG